MSLAASSSTKHAGYGWPATAPHRAALMAVLNVTPNSVSDGGRYTTIEHALARAQAFEQQGAAILDIGGESTHPATSPIAVDEELARVLPVIEALRGKISIPVSIDTYRPETAAAALEAGAQIVNDIWGFQRTPEMAKVVAHHGAGVCLMHNRHIIDATCDIMADIIAFFEKSLEIAGKAGVAMAAIVLDPGIGFGKTFEQNLIVLDKLEMLQQFGLPILVGASRKRFIGAITKVDVPDQRLNGSLAAHVAAVLKGASIIRAHDIAEHHEALAVATAIMRHSII